MGLQQMMCCGLKEGYQLANLQIPYTNPQFQGNLSVLLDWFRQCANIQALAQKGGKDPLLTGPRVFTPAAAHIVFTDAHDHVQRYGKGFAKFILKNKLGALVCTKPKRNPRYFFGDLITSDPKDPLDTHVITTWVWTPDWPRVRSLMEALLPPDPWQPGVEGEQLYSQDAYEQSLQHPGEPELRKRFEVWKAKNG